MIFVFFQRVQFDLRAEELMKPRHLSPILVSLRIDEGGAFRGRVLANETGRGAGHILCLL